MIDEKRLAEIEELASKATPAPWSAVGNTFYITDSHTGARRA